jgi:hypothetical protein
LTVSDGVHSAAITILGNHVTSNFTAVSDGNGGTLISDPQLPVGSGQAGDVQSGGTAVATTVNNGGQVGESSGGVDTRTAAQTSGIRLDSSGGGAINSGNSDVASTGSAITSGSSATTSDTTSSGSSPHQWWADLGGSSPGFFGQLEPELMAWGPADVGDPGTSAPGDSGEMAQFALWRQYTPAHFTWASDGGSSTPVNNPAIAANEMLAGNGGSQHLSHA